MRRSKTPISFFAIPSAAVSAKPNRAAAAERRKRRDPLRPGLPRRERHLDLGDDAVDAIGVEHLEDVAALQLDDARLLLDRDHLDGVDRAGIGILAPGAGAAAGRAAGGEAADRRLLARRRMEAELPAIGPERPVDVEKARTGLEPPGAGLRPDDAIEPADVEDDAALERHRLTVVARAAAAHRQRHAMARAGRGDPHHLVLGLRQDDEIGALVLQKRFQDRREPEEIAALQFDRRRIVGDGDSGKIGRGAPRSDAGSRPP